MTTTALNRTTTRCPPWCVSHETLEDGVDVHRGKPSKSAATLRVQPTLRFDCDTASVCILSAWETIECLTTEQAHKLARALSAAASMASSHCDRAEGKR